jgi:vitamin B12 transporter
MPFAPPATPTEVAPIVVQAARLPPSSGDAAFSIVTVDPQVLSDNVRLDDALAQVPGFSLFRRTSSLGANPTTQGVSLRGIAGSGASRALVTLDGVPQNDPFGGWVIWSGLPVETIGSATLVRGAGAGPYGAGALTGVVALQSPDSLPGGADADIQAGTLGYKRAAGDVEIDPGGTTRAFLGASGESSFGWVPVRYGYGPVDRELELHDWSASARVESNLGGVALAERLSAYEEDRGAGTEFAGSRARGAQGSITAASQPSDNAWGWRLQGWASGSDLENTTASVALNRQTATLADNQYATPAYGVGANAALRRTGDGASLELGTDVRMFQGESKEQLFSLGAPSGNRIAGGGEGVAGLYAEANLQRGPWLLAAGARADGWIDYNSQLVQTGSTVLNQYPGDRGGVVPTGRLGVRRDLSSDIYLRSAVYAGFRPATLNELHRPFRVGNDVTLANAALSPERLYGAELGVGGTRYVTWDLDGFYNQLANAIANVTIGHGPGSFPSAGFVPAGGTLYQRENAGRVNAYGLEGDAQRRFGASLRLSAAFSYTHARVDGGDQAPQLTGLRPAQTPEVVATASAQWQVLPSLSLTGEVRYEGARFDDDQNTRPISAGTGVNARVEYRLPNGVGLFLSAENLFDANIDTGRTAANVVSYDAPRIVSGGLVYRR